MAGCDITAGMLPASALAHKTDARRTAGGMAGPPERPRSDFLAAEVVGYHPGRDRGF
jgi:hypothetical protein